MKKISLLILLTVTLSSFGQTNETNPTEAVKTIDGIINESLKIITGERGINRDWEAYRNLFTPNAQLTVLNHGKNGENKFKTFSLEEFVRIGMKFYENDGFIEYELTKTVDEYNGIAHAFQSYYAKELEIEERGINSYQLLHDGKRWWITSILWTNDRNGVQLPNEYLKKDKS